MSIKYIPVKSSMIKSIGFNHDTNKIEVMFKNNVIYVYDNKTIEDFEAFRDATSIGKHFLDHIKLS